MSGAVAGGLAAATGERLAVALAAALVAVRVGETAATVWLGVSDRVALADAVAVGAGLDVAVGGGVVAVALAAGDEPARVAHAFVSCDSTERHTDFALPSHTDPSAAVRASDMRTKG